jgi:hypothetical protein
LNSMMHMLGLFCWNGFYMFTSYYWFWRYLLSSLLSRSCRKLLHRIALRVFKWTRLYFQKAQKGRDLTYLIALSLKIWCQNPQASTQQLCFCFMCLSYLCWAYWHNRTLIVLFNALFFLEFFFQKITFSIIILHKRLACRPVELPSEVGCLNFFGPFVCR